jgi:hypothetical protein
MRMLLVFLIIAGITAGAAVPEGLRSALTLHASFDKGFDADSARGDKRLFHAPNYKEVAAAKAGAGDVDVTLEGGSGIAGSGALRFRSKNTRALFFRGESHVAPAGGSISFWLRLDPQKDLAPGYCDPIQITDKDYNDSAIWVDFTKDEVPRQFRLGVFGELKSWNPANLAPDKNPDFLRRLVVVERPPFTRDTWTHVVVTWTGLGSEQGISALYLNGKLVSNSPPVREPFIWDASKVAIRLGVNYTGLMDELAVFNRALSSKEVGVLFNSVRTK